MQALREAQLSPPTSPAVEGCESVAPVGVRRERAKLPQVLVTGARGTIGCMIAPELRTRGFRTVEMDVLEDGGNILEPWGTTASIAIHLAADKHAGNGETDPERVADLNIRGTARVVERVPRVILASTCKAADPCTVYGASKMIAERIVLNAGGTVVRLVNVIGSSGSVTEIWGGVPEGEPLPVTNCSRLFMTARQAIQLLIDAISFPPGRYGPAKVKTMSPSQLARQVYPDRERVRIPLRRGDRPDERLVAEYEQAFTFAPNAVRIVDLWERS